MIQSVIGTGTGTLLKYDTGKLTLTRANTYTGLTTINWGGAINIQNANALGSTANGTVVQERRHAGTPGRNLHRRRGR